MQLIIVTSVILPMPLVGLGNPIPPSPLHHSDGSGHSHQPFFAILNSVSHLCLPFLTITMGDGWSLHPLPHFLSPGLSVLGDIVGLLGTHAGTNPIMGPIM